MRRDEMAWRHPRFDDMCIYIYLLLCWYNYVYIYICIYSCVYIYVYTCTDRASIHTHEHMPRDLATQSTPVQMSMPSLRVTATRECRPGRPWYMERAEGAKCKVLHPECIEVGPCTSTICITLTESRNRPAKKYVDADLLRLANLGKIRIAKFSYDRSGG